MAYQAFGMKKFSKNNFKYRKLMYGQAMEVG